jgi:hypothetical protein
MSTGSEEPRRTLADVDIGVLADAFVSRLVRQAEQAELCSFWSCSNRPETELRAAEQPQQPTG